MTDIPMKEGRLPFKVPSIDEACFTSYKVFGDLSSGHPPLVLVHGGPGAGHEYLLPFASLWSRYSIPVVFYDQIGCASSTHLPQTAGDETIWQESLFIAELNNLLDRLGLRDGPGFHLLGQSFGGSITAQLAADWPQGLRRLILASAVASTELAERGYALLVDQLPTETQQALKEGLETGDVNSPAFQAAMEVFYKNYMCRVEPFPPKELIPTFKHFAEDTTVKNTMHGLSAFKCTGSLRNRNNIPKLPKITAPTLIYNGEYDTTHDLTMAAFLEHIPQVRWVKFDGAGHMCHLEEEALREKVLTTVGEFLTQEI